MIKIRQKGNFNNLENFLKKSSKIDLMTLLNKCGEKGVSALRLATPIDSGETASSWGYEIIKKSNGYVIYWTNDNIVSGVSIALIIQYGHGTRNGGYVQGRDYINPSIRPIFDEMANLAWKDVISR